MCIVVNRAACTNPLYSLLLVQCLFWCFLTLLKLRPLRMRSRSSTPLNERKKMADEKKDEELTGSFSSTKDDGVLLRREDGY